MITVHEQENEPSVESRGITPEAVRAELRRITTSRHFRSSKRSQQFLEYVVEQKLQGNESCIKERLIGIEVFGRESNYATGDDPVVRVQAGEVRRRLELYRAESEKEDIWLELPIGTYVPVFRTRQAETAESAADIPAKSQEVFSDILPKSTDAVATVPSNSAPSLPEMTSPHVFVLPGIAASAKPVFSWRIIAFCLSLLLIGGAIGYLVRAPQHAAKAVMEFWGPIMSNPKPVVVNFGKPFVYAPSAHLFDEYANNHPGAFTKGVDRHNRLLPLDGKTFIQWSDMTAVSNSGPAVGGVRAGLTLTSFLGKVGKPFAVRFGDEGSFLELRDSPSIIVGAMNNRWTADLDRDFHFGIHDNNSYQYIEDKGTNRTWRTEYTERGAKDYGLITREPKGTTGEFLVKIAGLQDGGTEAACELVTNPEMMENVVRSLPSHWDTKNLQIVISTDVIGWKAGPPQVVAIQVW
jgi:hypothetical protein